MAKVAENVYNFIKPIVEGLNVELVEVEYEKKENGMNLSVFIDSAKGITIQDCEAVHRAIDGPLDELDPTEGKPYTLNVSSLGIDRAFKTNRDFEKNIGQEVEVRLFKPLNKKKVFEGVLVSFDDEVVTVSVDGEELDIERKSISKISRLIKF